jgi:hypothetical protein
LSRDRYHAKLERIRDRHVKDSPREVAPPMAVNALMWNRDRARRPRRRFKYQSSSTSGANRRPCALRLFQEERLHGAALIISSLHIQRRGRRVSWQRKRRAAGGNADVRIIDVRLWI